MPRIRSVHPGLFTDEAFAQLSEAAQIFWIGLWTEADDQGVFEWKPVTLKMRLRPASLTPVEPLLEELEKLDCIQKFCVNGRHYGAVRNFGRYQRPKKPNSIHPVPSEFRTYLALSYRSSEPDGDDEPPLPPNEEPGPNDEPSVPKKAELGPQMEDEGDNREEVKKDSELRSSAATAANDEPQGAVRAKRGKRLPEDWQPTEELRTYCRSLGVDPDRAAEEFRTYWLARAGKEATKVDWPLTFRGRCRELRDQRRYPVLPLGNNESGDYRVAPLASSL